MLTGESLPVEKAAGVDDAGGGKGPDAPHLVFLGTSVISGTATARAMAIGPRTLFGDIATRLSSRAPETEFEHGLRRFSLLILRTTVALVLFIVLTGIAVKHDPLDSLLFAVALGVGLTPEFLPMISAVTLTQGALRMAREQVIVKHLPADHEGRIRTDPRLVHPVRGGRSGDASRRRDAARVHQDARSPECRRTSSAGRRIPLDGAAR